MMGGAGVRVRVLGGGDEAPPRGVDGVHGHGCPAAEGTGDHTRRHCRPGGHTPGRRRGPGHVPRAGAGGQGEVLGFLAISARASGGGDQPVPGPVRRGRGLPGPRPAGRGAVRPVPGAHPRPARPRPHPRPGRAAVLHGDGPGHHVGGTRPPADRGGHFITGTSFGRRRDASPNDETGNATHERPWRRRQRNASPQRTPGAAPSGVTAPWWCPTRRTGGPRARSGRGGGAPVEEPHPSGKAAGGGGTQWSPVPGRQTGVSRRTAPMVDDAARRWLALVQARV
jgi:hypothetical protein